MKEWNTLPSFDVLETLIHRIDRELNGLDETEDVWDGYLRIVLKDYISHYEPPPDIWTHIKAKMQREALLNQAHSCGP